MRLITYAAGILLALMLTASPGFAEKASAETMLASWYGPGLEYNTTASGDVFEPYEEYTAASPYLPFGTVLLVCYSGCVEVVVTDYGPAAWTGRQLDLSYIAARDIGLLYPGVGVVDVYIVGYD